MFNNAAQKKQQIVLYSKLIQAKLAVLVCISVDGSSYTLSGYKQGVV